MSDTAMAAKKAHDVGEIARRVRITRQAMGLSQVDIVRRLGGDLTAQKWNNYERGRDRFAVEVAVLAAQKLGWSLDWIYWGNPSWLPYKLAIEIERRQKNISDDGGR